MIRISIAYFYDLGAALKPLESINGETRVLDAIPSLYTAKEILDGLFSADWFFPAIRSSYAPGQSLLSAINTALSSQDLETQIGIWNALAISRSYGEFLGALRAELAVADAYFVSRKGGYDTNALILAPAALFPSDLGTKVPLAVPDAREACKALAYELCTASGFHVLRATEAVLRTYWIVASEGKPHPKDKTLGVYLREMDGNNYGSEKVRAVLRQIKDLHRNPLAHPKDVLDLDQAVDLFGIARSAIGTMLREIPAPNMAVLSGPSIQIPEFISPAEE